MSVKVVLVEDKFMAQSMQKQNRRKHICHEEWAGMSFASLREIFFLTESKPGASEPGSECFHTRSWFAPAGSKAPGGYVCKNSMTLKAPRLKITTSRRHRKQSSWQLPAPKIWQSIMVKRMNEQIQETLKLFFRLQVLKRDKSLGCFCFGWLEAINNLASTFIKLR